MSNPQISFSRGGHSIRVVTLLDGDEYLSLQAMADDDGLSDSAFMRRLLKLEAQKRAFAQVSNLRARDASAEPAQVCTNSFGDARSQ
jgi:hypothetical protein